MASLELIPNPPVLVTQGAIFLANVVIVKKLMVDPYIRLRDKRDAMTVGNKDEAVRIQTDCDSLQETIAAKLSDAADAVKTERERIHDDAVAKRSALLQDAEKEAKATLETVRGDVARELAAEKAKVPEIVKSLTDEVYQAALN